MESIEFINAKDLADLALKNLEFHCATILKMNPNPSEKLKYCSI